jgi:hypothetical protein
MLNKNQCNYCLNKVSTSQLWLLKPVWWGGSKVCRDCLWKVKDEDMVSPVKTVEEYLIEKQGKLVQQTTQQSQSKQGTARINGRDCSVILEEAVTTTRRIKIEPKP